MNSIINTLGYSNVDEYDSKITTTLSSYVEKTINDDGSVNYKEINTTYFLENDKWHINFFENIPQFKEQVNNYKKTNKSMPFTFGNSNVNKEIKFIVYSKLFSDEWAIPSTLTVQIIIIRQISQFINDKYPNINSILDLNIDKANLKWVDWLNNKGIKSIVKNYKRYKFKEESEYRTSWNTRFLSNIYNYLFNLTDEREEWEKHIWDIRKLETYGINYGRSSQHHLINFQKINNLNIRCVIMKYFKERLIANNKFSWSTAQGYMTHLPNFINFICELEPTWNDLKGLKRQHIEKYLEWLNIYTKKSLTQKNSNPESYIIASLSHIQKFLSDIQIREYDIAPIKNIRMLMLPSDKPTIKKKPYDQIDYVSDIVLEQLFKHINNLHKEVIPVVWTMYKTGFRISDVLCLKQDCLVRLNNSFWIETDIEKTYVKGHRIPIDDELANMLAVLIDNAKANSNQDNNPKNYIFVRYKGSRKGKPYGQGWIQDNLNSFSMEYNITNETGNRYHFKNHSFRHTYAIKMLNGGADILTVQELLAHASPEMTMRYARLLDDTKRKVFDNVIKKGVFSFDEGSKLKEENNGEIPKDVLDMLWTNHKLSAIDTPYGTCLQRTNGKCSFAKQPPCLTCNGGNPCRDLCVGAFEGDIRKYEILINSTKSMIENARIYNRTQMVTENEELLDLYKEIYSKVIEGNIIYSRLDRLKKTGDINEQL